MSKGVMILSAILVLAIIVMGVVYFLNQGKQNAVNDLQQQNPNFHTVEQGGACEDGAGDCVSGLTCVDGTCQKP